MISGHPAAALQQRQSVPPRHLRLFQFSQFLETSGAGEGVPDERIHVADSDDFSGARFMESFESKHSDHDFTGRLSDAVGITAAPLRLDSQAKYGEGVVLAGATGRREVRRAMLEQYRYLSSGSATRPASPQRRCASTARPNLVRHIHNLPDCATKVGFR